MTTPAYVGIDVSKDHLDVAALPSAESWRTTGDPDGIDVLASRLADLPAALVVLEATGGHEHAVAVVNPRQVRSLRPCHRRARQDRGPRRPRAGPLRRAREARAPGAPRRLAAGTGGPPVPAAATHRDADRRAEPAAAR